MANAGKLKHNIHSMRACFDMDCWGAYGVQCARGGESQKRTRDRVRSVSAYNTAYIQRQRRQLAIAVALKHTHTFSHVHNAQRIARDALLPDHRYCWMPSYIYNNNECALGAIFLFCFVSIVFFDTLFSELKPYNKHVESRYNELMFAR